MAPSHRGVWLNSLKHTEGHISLKVSLDLLLPVGRYGGGDVTGMGLGGWVHVELKGQSMHHGQRLVGACVECGAPIMFQDYLL